MRHAIVLVTASLALTFTITAFAQDEESVDPKYTWYLTELFPSIDAWTDARDDILADFNKIQGRRGARPAPDLPPLPDVHRESFTSLVSPSWVIAGVVVVVLLVVGAVMFWGQGGGGSDSPVLVQDATPSNGNQGGGPPIVPVDEPGELVIEDGVTPDLAAQHLLVAITALTDAGVPYVVVEVDNEAVPSGIIFNQSPLAGTPLDDDTIVTILASR